MKIILHSNAGSGHRWHLGCVELGSPTQTVRPRNTGSPAGTGIEGVNHMAKILIVEDHTDIRKMKAIYLKMFKYEVIEAADGYEAVEKALKHKPDAILMDLAMPVLDGVDSARAMRQSEELADTPIVCITAYMDFYDQRAKDAGCNAVLQKPIDFGQLDSLLKEHIAA